MATLCRFESGQGYQSISADFIDRFGDRRAPLWRKFSDFLGAPDKMSGG
jgi:hypothetical protein